MINANVNHNIQVLDGETKELLVQYKDLLGQYLESRKPPMEPVSDEPRFRIRTVYGTDINIPSKMLKVGYGIGIAALITLSVCKIVETVGLIVN